MAASLTLTQTLEPRGPAGAFILTDEQAAALGGGAKAFPVTLTVNGTTVAVRLARMGGENLIGLNKAVRAELGLEIGEVATFDVAADAAPRTVEVPDDLAAALAADPTVAAAFEKLAYSHRKEFVRWVSEAKREQTRAERITKTVEQVRDGKTR